MKQQLKEALQARFPELKALVVERCVDKYTRAVMQEIGNQFPRMTKEDFEQAEMSFAEDQVSKACGQVDLAGARPRIYNVMQADPSTSLVLVTYKGNSIKRRVSKVTFNPKYKKNIMAELINLELEMNSKHQAELKAKANTSIKIDAESLASYITATADTLRAGLPEGRYKEELVRNYRLAQMILDNAREVNGETWVNEYWEEADSGRFYGQGVSLQRVPKHVRHAALGRCHKYDFQASSYALMTSLALAINPELQVSALKSYIKYRSEIRSSIAKDVGVSEDRIKAIFTSLGFGAEVKNNPFNSIRGTLGADCYAKLLANGTFARIKADLDAVTATIHQHFPNDSFEFYGRTYSGINPKDGTKRSKNQKLAWIYQCMEQQAIRTFMTLVPDEFQHLLTVHDCVYLAKALPGPVVQDIKFLLAEEFPLLTFDHEAIFPIHAAADHGKQQRHYEEEVAAHKARIWHSEQVAKGYRSVLEDGEEQPRKPVDYETQRRIQLELDVAMATSSYLKRIRDSEVMGDKE